MTFGLFMRLKWGRERFCHSSILFSDGIGMFVSDYEILGMRSLRVFQQPSFADALTRGASLVSASPRLDAAAPGSARGPRRSGRAVAEVRRLRGGEGQTRPQTQSCESHGELCWGGDPVTSCLFLVPSHSEEAK